MDRSRDRWRPPFWLVQHGATSEQPRTSRVVGRGNAPHRAAHARAWYRRSRRTAGAAVGRRAHTPHIHAIRRGRRRARPARRDAGGRPSVCARRRGSARGTRLSRVFHADFVWEVAVVAELAKGDMPPPESYYLNDDLHYYWLMHLLRRPSSTAPSPTPTPINCCSSTRSGRRWRSRRSGKLLVRHFVSSPWAAAIGCIFVLLGTSLEGIDRLWCWNGNIQALRNTNIDAVTDWDYQGMRADGLHRLLLYQPQHKQGTCSVCLRCSRSTRRATSARPRCSC